MECKREERRRDRRYLCSHLVEVVLDGVPDTVVLEDLGPDGAAVATEFAIEAGTLLELSAPGLRARAEVRYCLRRENDFRWGLRFRDGFRWQATAWQPDHLWLPPEPVD